MVQRAKILFPLSQIGAITNEQRCKINETSRISGKYESTIDRGCDIMKGNESTKSEEKQHE